MAQRSLADEVRLRSIMEALKEEPKDQVAWTEAKFRRHLSTWERMGKRTIETTMRDLRRMAGHPLRPVRPHGSRFELVTTFLEFAYHREHVEGKLGTALKNDYKAMRILCKYRGIPLEVLPKPPPILEQPKAILPSPEQIHELLHAEFVPDAKNSYEQHLIQSLLAFDFGFGPRFPSEAHALQLGFLDAERHLLIIQEPKKSNRKRRLIIEPEWLCCSPTRPSLAQYPKHWRWKVDVGGTDAFYLKPDGQPFPTKEAVTQWLLERVKPKFPWFYPYLGRHWCANARLIETRTKDGTMDFVRVAKWLGHNSVTTLRRYYEHDVEMHYKLYGDNWLERAFHGRGKHRPKPANRKGAPTAVRPGAGSRSNGQQAEPSDQPSRAPGPSGSSPPPLSPHAGHQK